jgi:protein ImuB
VWSSVSSSQRILSLWLERLSTDRIARLRDKASPPLVVFGKRGNLDLLVAVDAAAERLGLTAGLALTQARAMHPTLAAVPEDAAADARLIEAVADWCQRYTPLIAVDPPDGILLDIGGCAHLFGGEERLRDDLLARMTQFGFSARAVIASTIGAAWAAARFGDATMAGQASRMYSLRRSCSSEVGNHPTSARCERERLVPLPLAALRLPSETVAALTRLGLKRIGDILDLPRAPLAARFGADLLRQLDRALGREDEPLAPRLPVPPYVAERIFHEPIAREEAVLATIERLAARLKTALAARGDGARRLELALFRTDGTVKRIAAGTSRPIRDPQAIRALFVERLAALGDEVDPGFGFDLARLSVLTAEPCPDEQIGLGGHEDRAELDRLVDRLSARLGRRRVARLVAHDSHSPERAARALPAQDMAQALAHAALASEASGQRGNSISARAGHSPELGSSAHAELGWEAWRRFRIEVDLSPRPLRLLVRPEPIEDVFALVPDGPPVRFRWRRALHEVVASEGPERIEGAWWSEDGPARDYFRVEDKAGLCFWLFRAGLYRDLAVPRWFLHGMYA